MEDFSQSPAGGTLKLPLARNISVKKVIRKIEPSQEKEQLLTQPQ
jgi:hypothetical protein